MDSKTVFALRNEAKDLEGISKLNKLTEALNLSKRLFSSEPYDDWIQKAFAYTLIDLSKYYIANNNLNQAGIYFNRLISIDFQEIDEIIENQKSFLRPRIDINYSEVQKAEEFSKNGKNQEALSIFKNLIFQNKLTELHHESYGWVIYRYIKAEENNLSSVEVRTFLRDYMYLKNERPSMLHSMILNFALNYSKTHSDFKFYSFFLLWNPVNLRYEDLRDGYKEGKSIPSLISRICKEFVNTNTEFDIEDFLDKVDLYKETVLDFIREAYFWNIFNAHKENRFSDLWNLFEKYNVNYSKHGQSKWHSEILNLAERFMKENDERHFLNFFKNWNPENLRSDDWKETKKDEHTYKPLAIKAIKKAFEVLKTQTSEQNLSWLIQPYEKAIKLFPDDEWLLREKALLHFKNNELDLAIKIYKQLVLELADKHYVWQEFSDCIVSDNSLKIGMLSKALSLEKNEDFLGDIHLDLAKLLIDENLLENVLVELEAYKKHRELKGWKLSSLYEDLSKKVSSVKLCLTDNRELYKKFSPFAENFAYADFHWTEVVLVDKWKDDKGKDRLTFTDGKSIEFVISKNRFEILKQSELGQILNFKLHKQEIKKEVEAKFALFGKTVVTEYKYIPLVVEKSEKKHWEILEDVFAIIDYINKEKNIIHAISMESKEVFFPQIKSELQIGDFVTAKSYVKKVKDEQRTELRQIQKIDIETCISKFHAQIAIVDGVNEQKQLFHFFISSWLHGIIKYSETNLRPNEGDFIKIWCVTKLNKESQLKLKVLKVENTIEIDKSLAKDVYGILKVKYRNNESLEDFDKSIFFLESYKSDEDWKNAIIYKYFKKYNLYPKNEEVNKIFEITNELLKNDQILDAKVLMSEENKHNENKEISNKECDEISDEMFDEKGKLLIDKLYPDLFKDNESKNQLSDAIEFDDYLLDIAITVIKDNKEIENELITRNTKLKFPDFAFIEDYHVPKYILEKNNITNDCKVKARIVYANGKWQVKQIKKM